MTFDDILENMFLWGYQIKPEHYQGFKTYFETMLKMDRVIIVYNDDCIDAVITFFLTKDYNISYRKGTWDIPQDDPEGHQIYIDKLVGNYNFKLARLIRKEIEDRFPKVMEGYYHRSPKDRLFKIRRTHELQNSIC